MSYILDGVKKKKEEEREGRLSRRDVVIAEMER